MSAHDTTLKREYDALKTAIDTDLKKMVSLAERLQKSRISGIAFEAHTEPNALERFLQKLKRQIDALI